jgi:hypothetical protein
MVVMLPTRRAAAMVEQMSGHHRYAPAYGQPPFGAAIHPLVTPQQRHGHQQHSGSAEEQNSPLAMPSMARNQGHEAQGHHRGQKAQVNPEIAAAGLAVRVA